MGKYVVTQPFSVRSVRHENTSEGRDWFSRFQQTKRIPSSFKIGQDFADAIFLSESIIIALNYLNGSFTDIVSFFQISSV